MKLAPSYFKEMAGVPLPGQAQKREPPYPFCCHQEKCIEAGRCERRVNGELWCCAD